VVAFLLAPTVSSHNLKVLARCLTAGALSLAIITVLRYLMYVRWGQLPVAPEFAFAHDSSLFLMLAIVYLGAVVFTRTGGRFAWLQIGTAGFMLIAMLMTGRRSATLVAIAGMGTMLFALYPARKARVILLSLALVSIGSLYLATYWNTPYGTIAQPARAVRSQIDPSSRDESSDTYRDTEKYDLIQTIQSSPFFGVGFGNPFYRFQPLPDLRDFWPLQYYTSHQNILWLWLKMGIFGITAVIATFALALNRCLLAIRRAVMGSPTYLASVTVAAGLLMYISFATVDLVFPSTRAMCVLGFMFAIAFQLSSERRSRHGELT
jgi:hypothetical protein